MVYYPHMPSIVGKRRGKHTYYYLVESARVDGQPRIVSQQYLGTAEEVLARLSGTATGEPARSQHKQFGDLAAVWSMLERLDVAGVIDQVVPRYANAAASVGTYLALATANRIVDPCSKRGFGDWWATTAGPRWVKLPQAALDHRRFWDAMDRLGEADLRRIETALGRRMVGEFGLDLSGLVLDMTNFATFIDSTNDRAPIAQRGKAKQKRSDLRLVGLALVVTRDGGVPLVWHAYPGDRPDVTQFSAVIDELVGRYRDLSEHVESLTVVYDAGQNSADNHTVIEALGIGFVGSLPPSDHPDLLAVPRSRYTPVDADRYPGLACVDTTVTALGVTRRAVLTHSPTLHAAQSRGLDQTLGKPADASPSCKPSWPAARPVDSAPPWRPRSPRSASPAGWARSSPLPSPASARPSCACPGAATPAPATAWKPRCSASGSCSPTATGGPSPTWSPPTVPSPRSNQASAR